MATNNQDSAIDIRYDEFISQVKPDPGSTEQIVLLQGYIGKGGSEEKIRLYSSADLSAYVDIDKVDILHAVKNEQDPLGGSTIWVKQTANLQVANIKHSSAKDYATGDMYSEYMNTTYTAPQQNFSPSFPIRTSTNICNRTVIHCRRTSWEDCMTSPKYYC